MSPGVARKAPRWISLLALLGSSWFPSTARAAAPDSAATENPKTDTEHSKGNKFSPWQSKKATPFVSLATDAGIIYFRPRLTLGYGSPFWNFIGLDAHWLTTNSFSQPYVGFRASLPFMDAMLGTRLVFPFNRKLLEPKDSYRADDLELDGNSERSVYRAVDFELNGAAPALHGAFFLGFHPLYIDAPKDVLVYEEVVRAVMVPPFALGIRGGYVYGVGAERNWKFGFMAEYVVTPGRPRNVTRLGPIALANFSKHLEGLAAFSFVVDGPDSLGIEHGTYAFLGILHRWAARL